MGHLPFYFLKQPVLAITLFLLLFISFFCCYSYIFSVTIFTLLVLSLSTSFPFIFSKIKQLPAVNMIEKPKELDVCTQTDQEDEISEEKIATLEEESEEDIASKINEQACSSPDPWEGLVWPEMDVPLLRSNEIFPEEANWIPPICSIASMSDDEALPENASHLSECSEGSISEDDSLIEITLLDDHYFRSEEQNELFPCDKEGNFSPEFSSETLSRSTLSEINEEDNLIEIDITMGSIKCSGDEIKA